MDTSNRKTLATLALAALAVAAALAAWWALQGEELPAGIASSNGRIEAVEINVATKTPGRLASVEVDDGDFVRAGDVLARMDTNALEAQKRQAEAQLRQARSGVDVARSQQAQRISERAAAQAVVAQREAELNAAERRFDRTKGLAEQNAASQQQLDDATAAFHQARAAHAAAQGQVQAAEAAITTARAQILGAEADVEAAQAAVERLQADIDDGILRAPRDGRVQYVVARPGEVLGAGGNVVNLIDLGDVYMTIFLPTTHAGRLAIGAEARLVLDAAPQYVIPAAVSFVADVAQFTPQTVETAEERQKLMFRVRLQIPKALLQEYLLNVKTGLPGMGYVRVDPEAAWPPKLEVRLP
ncbi:MAG: HlyD family secretion protein [Pseudomonadota bacterium]